MNYLRNTYRYRDLLSQLVVRDVKLKFRRSFLGYLWSVLNPLGIMIVLTIVFSNMFRFNIEYFPAYLITGQVLFGFLTESTTQSIYSIFGNASLLKKTYIPKYILTFSKVTSSMVNLLFSLVAMFLVILITGVPLTWKIALFPVVLVQFYVFCLGLSLFLAQFAVFFRDIQYIYNVITTAWMYLTPIFYPIEMLPTELAWVIEHLNPIYLYIQQFRCFMIYGTLPELYTVLAGVFAAVATLVIGAWSFFRNQDKFILYM